MSCSLGEKVAVTFCCLQNVINVATQIPHNVSSLDLRNRKSLIEKVVSSYGRPPSFYGQIVFKNRWPKRRCSKDDNLSEIYLLAGNEDSPFQMFWCLYRCRRRLQSRRRVEPEPGPIWLAPCPLYHLRDAAPSFWKQMLQTVANIRIIHSVISHLRQTIVCLLGVTFPSTFNLQKFLQQIIFRTWMKKTLLQCWQSRG